MPPRISAGRTGTVTPSAVSNYQYENDTIYHWDLAYRYEVNGQVLTGSRYRQDGFSISQSSGLESADQVWVRGLAAKYPVGAPVQVFYNPKIRAMRCWRRECKAATCPSP
jgi:hypothetical protein